MPTARRFSWFPWPARRSGRCLHAWLGLLLFWGGLAGGLAWDADRMTLAAARQGDAAVQGLRALRQALSAAVGQPEAVQLGLVNEFYNRRLVFRDDLDNWGQVDYWASPMESLQRGQADCEDFAIAKYFTLAGMGVPHQRLRLVYVRATQGGPGGPVQAHMVLAYYPSLEAEPLVLDNLITEVRPAGRRPDLAPVFSFNAEGIWEGVGGVSVAGQAADRLSRWRDVLQRARQEGFF
jgi:predicted transglutaminase-like cysteine proteinase